MRLSPAILLATALITVAGCSRPPPAASGPDFHPERWFLGHMHSTGSLKPTLGKAHDLHVDSTGAPGGGVRLDQAIHWTGGAVDHRYWIMQCLPQGGYRVSLTEAAGPVAFEVHGPRAHLRYRDRRAGGLLTIEQWMDLTPGGRTLDNHGAVTILGVPVARLEETIFHDPT